MQNDKQEQSLTLDDLNRMKPVIAIRRLALAVGMQPVALKQRMRRGTPELTYEESTAISQVLYEAGLEVVYERPDIEQ